MAPCLASLANVSVHLSATPNAIANGRYVLKMSSPSSYRNLLPSAVDRNVWKPFAWARIRVPSALRAGAALVVATVMIPRSTIGMGTSPHDPVSASARVSPAPRTMIPQPDTAHLTLAVWGLPRNHPRRVTSLYSWLCTFAREDANVVLIPSNVTSSPVEKRASKRVVSYSTSESSASLSLTSL